MHAHSAPPSNILAVVVGVGHRLTVQSGPLLCCCALYLSSLCMHICMDICACVPSCSCTHFRLARTSSTWFLGRAAQWSRGIPWHVCVYNCIQTPTPAAAAVHDLQYSDCMIVRTISAPVLIGRYSTSSPCMHEHNRTFNYTISVHAYAWIMS